MCCTVALASDKKNALAGGNTAEGLCVLAYVCGGQAFAVPVGGLSALSLKVLISLGDAAAVHFVNLLNYWFGIVRYCLHIYALPCIAPVANYFFVTIL
jgi:hypothetical protein